MRSGFISKLVSKSKTDYLVPPLIQMDHSTSFTVCIFGFTVKGPCPAILLWVIPLWDRVDPELGLGYFSATAWPTVCCKE